MPPWLRPARWAAPPPGSCPNHDVVRHPTRLGLPSGVRPGEWLLDGDRGLLDADRGATRARAAVLLMLALPGSAYLYQGEELGLPEVHDLPLDVRQDPAFRRTGESRDGCRGCPGPARRHRSGSAQVAPWLPAPATWSAHTRGRPGRRAQIDAFALPGGPTAAPRPRARPGRDRHRRLLRRRRRGAAQRLRCSWSPTSVPIPVALPERHRGAAHQRRARHRRRQPAPAPSPPT